MVVSEKLDQFFTAKMKNYPVRRSYLVPMLLYVQDELGYLTDDLIKFLSTGPYAEPAKPWYPPLR